LCLNERNFGEIIPHDFGMGGADEEIGLPEVKDSVKHAEIVLF
jgi:hypothetical protein